MLKVCEIILENKLLNKIRNKKAKIAVMGLGYVGLPTATIFANLGFKVTGIDVNQKIVDGISKNRSHTKEPGLDKLIAKASQQGNLKATESALKALGEADIVIVSVQTPIKKNGEPNLTPLKKACDTIKKALTKGKLIIIQSTVPAKAIRTYIVPLLEKGSGLRCGVDFWLTYCPERMSPGNGLADLATNSRLIGGYDLGSTKLGAELFKNVTRGELQLTDLTTAEVAKLAENTFRYINIAFANELALFCKEIGVDVVEVINLANTHPKVKIHKPGCGVGGPCLSKDTNLLLKSIKTKSFRPEVVLASKRLNQYMPKYVAKQAVNALRKVGKRIENSKIAIFGTAYKGEVSDARDSPAKEIIRRLMSLKANVVVYDPYCPESFGARKVKDLIEAVEQTDCILIATDHKVFSELNLSRLKALMNKNPIFVDGRRVINPIEAEKQGFIYVGIGYSNA